MQFAEIELDPGESVVAEAGALMFKDASIAMDTIFGDGTKREGGLFGAPTCHIRAGGAFLRCRLP